MSCDSGSGSGSAGTAAGGWRRRGASKSEKSAEGKPAPSLRFGPLRCGGGGDRTAATLRDRTDAAAPCGESACAGPGRW
jgi:hypothetical protein